LLINQSWNTFHVFVFSFLFSREKRVWIINNKGLNYVEWAVLSFNFIIVT